MEIVPNMQHKILKKHWNILKDLYKIYWPRHILSYYTLKTYIEWKEKNPKLDITIFTSDDDWKTHGTYVIVEQCGPRCNILFNTLDAEKYEELLLKAFENVPVDRSFTLAAFVDKVSFITNRFLANHRLKRESIYNTLLYYLPLKESVHFQKKAMPGYTFHKLSLDDVQQIDNLWPHRYPGSDILIGNIIRYNMTLGAYEEETGELRGWVMQEQIGTIGLLQVEDSCKRKGLDEQLVTHMIVMLASAGMDAIATIWSTNRTYRKLFHKLGFKIIGRVSWLSVMPPIEEKPLENEKINCI